LFERQEYEVREKGGGIKKQQQDSVGVGNASGGQTVKHPSRTMCVYMSSSH
jgi:hypothetical protein